MSEDGVSHGTLQIPCPTPQGMIQETILEGYCWEDGSVHIVSIYDE